MRSAVGIFGLLCAVVIIGLVGRYGFKSTELEADAWIMAFLFGVVATAGLAGHVVCVRLWQHSRLVSVAVGLVAAVALLLNLSNSLGAIAGRADGAAMERIAKNRAIRASESELKRLMSLRTEMPAFTHTDADAVSAAKRAADAATNARKAECGNGDPKQRGRFCRDREDAEKSAGETLARATAAKAATDRATQLEADAAAQRAKLGLLGPLVTENVQGSAIAKLFRLQAEEADFAAIAQQFGMAVVVELIIIVSLVAWEVLGSAKPSVPAPAERQTEPTSKPEEGLSAINPPKPRLVASESKPVGNVMSVLSALVEPGNGKTEIADAYSAYAAACRKADKQPVPPDKFVEPVRRMCRAAKIEIEAEGEHVYLMRVQLKKTNEEHQKGLDATS